jgi:two-component system KDP operon response regulator KdpE
MTNQSGKNRILAIDDEPQMRRLLKTTLTAHGYDFFEATDGEDGIQKTAEHNPDLVILDMNLPDINGLKVLKQLRGWFTRPSLVLSVVSDQETIVQALDNGADDYLTKPFGVPELLARLRVCLRREMGKDAEPIFKSGLLTVDLSKREVLVNESQIHLTATEYNLLRLFIKHAGKVLTHTHILREVWGPGAVEDVQYLRVYIGHLRQKIETDPNRPELILTEPGVGYRLQMK